MMKKWFICLGFILPMCYSAFAQNLGVSFSFFFPKNGEIATPISPFSYRGVALPFTNSIGLQTGITLYRMPGLSIKGLPFSSDRSLYGPSITGYVPLELYFQAGSQQATFTFKGGLFGFYSMFTKLNYGNFDRAIRSFENWDVVNADFNYSKLPGWGYQGGIELLLNVSRKFGITLELNYLLGSAPLKINGSYTGGTSLNGIETKTVEFPDSSVDLSGIEISLGAVF